MKNTILICLLLFLVSNVCQTQDYYPFPESNAIWKETIQIVTGPGSTTGEHFQLEMIGDTTLLETIWNKLYKINSWDSIGNDINTKEYLGSIREDSSKHIYYIPKDSEAFYLLYDFNIEVGDTLQLYEDSTYHFYGGTIGNYFVLEVDSVMIKGIPRRRFEIRITENPQGFSSYEIIEGIGSINGLLTNKGNTGGYSSWLWCFWQNGELIYSKNEESCINTSINEYPKGKQISCFPNPCIDQLLITGVNLKNANILLLNLDGRILINNLINKESESINLNLGHVQSGIYFLLIVQNKKILFSEKIVRL